MGAHEAQLRIGFNFLADSRQAPPQGLDFLVAGRGASKPSNCWLGLVWYKAQPKAGFVCGMWRGEPSTQGSCCRQVKMKGISPAKLQALLEWARAVGPFQNPNQAECLAVRCAQQAQRTATWWSKRRPSTAWLQASQRSAFVGANGGTIGSHGSAAKFPDFYYFFEF